MTTEQWAQVKHSCMRPLGWSELYVAIVLGAALGVLLSEYIIDICTKH
jgi:hypothetical protein